MFTESKWEDSNPLTHPPFARSNQHSDSLVPFSCDLWELALFCFGIGELSLFSGRHPANLLSKSSWSYLRDRYGIILLCVILANLLWSLQVASFTWKLTVLLGMVAAFALCAELESRACAVASELLETQNPWNLIIVCAPLLWRLNCWKLKIYEISFVSPKLTRPTSFYVHCSSFYVHCGNALVGEPGLLKL